MPDTSFRAEFKRDGDREILAVSGDLDYRSAFAFWGALELVPEDQHIVIDCSAVDFMDSRGLRAILIQRQRRARSGGTLTIRHPSDAVVLLMDACGGWAQLLEQPLAS